MEEFCHRTWTPETERNREKQRETKRNRDRDREKQRQRQTERDRDRETETGTETETERQRQRQRDRDRETETDKQRERERDRERERLYQLWHLRYRRTEGREGWEERQNPSKPAPQSDKPRVLQGGVRRSRSRVSVRRPAGDCPASKAVRGSGGCPKDQRFRSSAADSLFSLEWEFFPLNVIYPMERPLRFENGGGRYAIHGEEWGGDGEWNVAKPVLWMQGLLWRIQCRKLTCWWLMVVIFRPSVGVLWAMNCLFFLGGSK